MENTLFDWPIVLQYDVKAKYRLISRKFSPFDKPIKSLYFRSFVVSVLFARFDFTVIRKSLYQNSNSKNCHMSRMGSESTAHEAEGRMGY